MGSIITPPFTKTIARIAVPHRRYTLYPAAQTWCQRPRASSQRRNVANYGGPPMPEQVAYQNEEQAKSSKSGPSSTVFKMFEGAFTTAASLVVLGMAGYGYHRYYKYLVLKKMENAFAPGDPVLDLAAITHNAHVKHDDDEDEEHWVKRQEQNRIDAIVNGTERGRYYLIIGEKGTGKSSMLLDAMAKVDGEGISMFDAHADLEIFRIRLGKALDFEFHEDYIGSLFSIRGPRDTTALLDIERAFNKLEKVALRRRKKVGRPLVLIINSTHLLRDDEDGRNLLELIQQRAEQWSASNLITVIFNSDDYWVYERLKGLATRLEVLPISDLPKNQAVAALQKYRYRYLKEQTQLNILEEVYDQIGGRVSFLNQVAKAPDILRECEEIYSREKTWLYNQCWILGEEMDDDVMDQQKYCSAAMVLAKALVDSEDSSETSTYHPVRGHILPEIPLHEARQIMTRADFIQSYDHINIFTIDSRAMVRADSVPMHRAFRELCSTPGFEEHLQATLDRISAIESLGRTREVVAKDLVLGGKYEIRVADENGRVGRKLVVELVPQEEEGKN